MATARQPSRRDGHLSDLDLELLFAEPDAHPVLADHCAGCAPCGERLARLQREEETFRELPPPVALASSVAPSPTVSRPANRRWIVLGTLIAAAAAVLLGVRFLTATRPTGDAFRLKGGAVDLEVFVNDGANVRATTTEDTVHPGDRLGFRVTPRKDGYLMVLGFDATGAYPCWPQRRAPAAEAVSASGTAMDLDAAIRLDARLGTERIVAVLCEAPIGWDDAIVVARHGGVDGGCVTDEVVLHKVEAP